MRAESIRLAELEALVEKGRELQKILDESPGILKFMERRHRF